MLRSARLQTPEFTSPLAWAIGEKSSRTASVSALIQHAIQLETHIDVDGITVPSNLEADRGWLSAPFSTSDMSVMMCDSVVYCLGQLCR
jgi:hypothetical protein